MGNSSSSAFREERAAWTKDHSLMWDHKLRENQLRLLDEFGERLEAKYIERKIRNVSYQHWYITDGTWVFEFSNDGSVGKYSIRVHSNNMSHGPTYTYEEFRLSPEVRVRMENLCGATNYSLALRNCEHAARYIQCGMWISMQMLGKGPLHRLFFKSMKGYMAHLNTLPLELRGQDIPPEIYYPEIKNDQKITYCRKVTSLTAKDNDAYNILVLGPTNSGKSTLINNLVNEHVCSAGARAESLTRQIEFIQCKAKVYDQGRRSDMDMDMNIVDTVGFCDSKLPAQDVTELIKSSLKMNTGYLDKVIVVCSDRIQRPHQEAIRQFFDWLRYRKHKTKFMIIYNKADNLDEGERQRDLGYMCDQLKVDPTICHFDESRRIIQLNMAVGFPPNAAYEDVREDHSKLIRTIVRTRESGRRIRVDEQSCHIL